VAVVTARRRTEAVKEVSLRDVDTAVGKVRHPASYYFLAFVLEALRLAIVAFTTE
jgi:hypothetical protein